MTEPNEKEPMTVRLSIGTGNPIDEWVAAWSQTTWLHGRIGLLHALPKDRGKLWGWSIGKLLLFADPTLMELKFVGGNKNDEYEAKKSLARTSLTILNRSLFSTNESVGDKRESWKILFFNDTHLVEAFVKFFRAREDHCGLVNFPTGLFEDKTISADVKQFVLDLCDYVWMSQRWSSGWSINKKTEEMLLKLRPQTLEILCALRMALHFCMGRDICDEETLKELERIALRAKIRPMHGMSERPVTSIEEAVYANSHAAHTLLVLRTRNLVQAGIDEDMRIENEKNKTERARLERERLIAERAEIDRRLSGNSSS